MQQRLLFCYEGKCLNFIRKGSCTFRCFHEYLVLHYMICIFITETKIDVCINILSLYFKLMNKVTSGPGNILNS